MSYPIDCLDSEKISHIKHNVSDIKKRIPNLIINLHNIKSSEELSLDDEIGFFIRNISVSISSIHNALRKTNISD